jgi:hypothetical protein
MCCVNPRQTYHRRARLAIEKTLFWFRVRPLERPVHLLVFVDTSEESELGIVHDIPLPLLPAFVLASGDRIQLINIVTAMATHASETYGDSRSPNHSKRSASEQHVGVEGHRDQPILAHFQKRPKNL